MLEALLWFVIGAVIAAAYWRGRNAGYRDGLRDARSPMDQWAAQLTPGARAEHRSRHARQVVRE